MKRDEEDDDEVLDIETPTSGIELKNRLQAISDDAQSTSNKKRKSTDSGIDEEIEDEEDELHTKKEKLEIGMQEVEDDSRIPQNQESSSAFNTTTNMGKLCASGTQFGQLVHYNQNQWVHSMVPLMMHGAYGQFKNNFAKSLLSTKRTESA